jgi:hypothetical protein
VVQTQGQLASDIIAVHKALGGGWEIRRGRAMVPEDVRAEMEERVDWGALLDPSMEEGPGVPRSDPPSETDPVPSPAEGAVPEREEG